MELLGAKILTMTLLGGIAIIVGILPIFLRKFCNIGSGNSPKGQLFLSALSCFGGGVILTTCFTHMLPEVNHFLDLNIKNGHFPKTGMAMAEIMVLCGFFMIYLVEEITHIVVDKMHHGPKVADVNGHTPSTKDSEEAEPMTKTGHQHVHEEVPIELLGAASDSEQQFQATLRGFLVILALSLHAVFEGIAMGLTRETKGVWYLFFAIASHKYVISFCVGMQFINSGLKTWVICIYVSTFALISPVGVAIGILLIETLESEASAQGSLVVILQGLAAGTLLYVVFFEVIEKERVKGTNGLVQVSFLGLGCLAMILLEVVGLELEASPESTEAMSINLGLNCTLEKVEPFWKYPMNFTCSPEKAILTPLF